MATSKVLKKIKDVNLVTESGKYLINRNPRNLEKLRIAYKPSGFHLEKQGKSFWNKLELYKTNRYITARVTHYKNGPVIEASTKEWAIKKQLYKTTDASAYINLAKVLANRCHEIGLIQMSKDITAVSNGKTEMFLKTLQEEGILLEEPERYMPRRPWDIHKLEKPWDIIE